MERCDKYDNFDIHVKSITNTNLPVIPFTLTDKERFEAIAVKRSISPSLGIRLALFLIFFMITHLSYSQTRVSVELKDTTIFAVFDQIRKQSDIDFIYNHESLENIPPISISVNDFSVDDILKICFEGTPYSYKKINNTIIIIPLAEASNPKNTDKITGKLKGRVLDIDSRIPLPSATVLVLSKDGMRAVSANEQGFFKFNKIPIGRHSIRVSYIGYQEIIMSELFVGSSKEVDVTISLKEKIDSLSEISVGISKGAPVNDMAIVSSRSFSVEETKRYAASISDPARMAQVFAGVMGHDDSSNEIVIRGNSPNWMQWRLEGVEIPSPNHFSEEGYTSGAVSILSSDLLAKSDFYMGAFPAEFGNALSGVFDLRLRTGNNEDYQFSAQAGVLGLDFSAEGPLKKGYDGSFLVNYRYSTLSILNKVNIQVSENAVPSYQDLSFKLNLPGKKLGTFSLWGIGGDSEIHEESYAEIALNNGISNGYRDLTESGMYALGLTHTLFPDHKSFLRTVVSSSMNYSSQTFETWEKDNIAILNFEDNLQKDAIRVNTVYNRKVSQKLTLRVGATLNNIGYSFRSRFTNSSGNLSTFVNGEGRTNLFQTYLQSKYRISEKISSTFGLHYAFFTLSNDRSVEPRLGFLIDLNNQQKLSFGYGRHSKNEDLLTYFIQTEDEMGNTAYPNLDLKLTRADHFIVGYEKMFGDDIQVKSEVYFQKINNLPVSENPQKYWPPSFGDLYQDTLANIGESRNYGIELTVQKFFTNSYYLMFTSSVFDAKYKPANGEWFNSKYNTNYASNLIGGKEFKWGTNKLIGLNAKAVWYGGKRMLPLDLDASIEQGKAVYMLSKTYSKKGPDYFRIDLGFNIHFFKEKSEHIVSLNIQNATNHQNILSEEYNPITQSLDHYYLTGFLPIMQYRVEF